MGDWEVAVARRRLVPDLDGLHPAVGEVPDEAAHTQRPRTSRALGAVEDALDPPRDHDPNPPDGDRLHASEG